MKVALTGYSNSGRSTVFSALCDSSTETSVDKGRLKVKLGVSKIVDPRLDKVAEVYKSAKRTYSEIHFSDFDYAEEVDKKGFDEQMIAQLKMVDALIYVTRGFVNPRIYYRFDKIDPFRDAREIESDMLITDLTSAENRLAKIDVDLRKGKKELQPEYDLIMKIKNRLESELPLRHEKFSQEQELLIRGFGFLTQKKGIVLINADDDDGGFPGDLSEIQSWAETRGLGVLVIRGKLQSELRELDESDRKEFIDAMGVDETALDKLIKSIYKTMGLITFFTANENEARSWAILKGSTAFDAAGVVHTDFQRKFIRAEVIRFTDLVKFGNEKACREAGVFKSEKKEYVVNDGDIIFIRHS